MDERMRKKDTCREREREKTLTEMFSAFESMHFTEFCALNEEEMLEKGKILSKISKT